MSKREGSHFEISGSQNNLKNIIIGDSNVVNDSSENGPSLEEFQLIWSQLQESLVNAPEDDEAASRLREVMKRDIAQDISTSQARRSVLGNILTVAIGSSWFLPVATAIRKLLSVGE